jgi:hypothetical protein
MVGWCSVFSNLKIDVIVSLARKSWRVEIDEFETSAVVYWIGI